jgi:hypothetical protein
MLKKVHVTIIALAIVFLSGCETSNAVRQASTEGLANMFTCDNIATAFSAYDKDKSSFIALQEVTKMAGIDSSAFDSSDAASYFSMVKTGVNTALMLKGCSAI